MVNLYVCPTDSKTYPTEEEFVHHQRTAHPPMERCMDCRRVAEAISDEVCPATRSGRHERVVPAMTTDQMRSLYEVVAFAAPYVEVRRRSDGARGVLSFDHAPRYYYNFEV